MTMKRLQTKALLMARSGMLECAKNYKNKYKSTICSKCKIEDDEVHRLNHCILHRDINNYDKHDKFDYNLVYSEQPEELSMAAKAILDVWDLANGRNTMRFTETEDVT